MSKKKEGIRSISEEATFETFCILNTPQITGNDQHNIGIMNQPTASIFQESV
jgi:hypothetical protein